MAGISRAVTYEAQAAEPATSPKHRPPCSYGPLSMTSETSKLAAGAASSRGRWARGWESPPAWSERGRGRLARAAGEPRDLPTAPNARSECLAAATSASMPAARPGHTEATNSASRTASPSAAAAGACHRPLGFPAVWAPSRAASTSIPPSRRAEERASRASEAMGAVHPARRRRAARHRAAMDCSAVERSAAAGAERAAPGSTNRACASQARTAETRQERWVSANLSAVLTVQSRHVSVPCSRHTRVRV